MATLEGTAAAATTAAATTATTTGSAATTAPTAARTAQGLSHGADNKQRERGHGRRSEEFQRFHLGHPDTCWRPHRFATLSPLK